MKVKELIERLKRFDPEHDAFVEVWNDANDYDSSVHGPVDGVSVYAIGDGPFNVYVGATAQKLAPR